MPENKQTVVVLGASPKPERYSNQTLRRLQQHGHRVIPVHPAIAKIDGLPVSASLRDISEQVDTLTLYVSAAHSTPMIDDIVALKPARVIFNPGTESPALKQALQVHGIPFEEACTLVLLNTGQF